MIVYNDEVLCQWASLLLLGRSDIFDHKARAIGVEKDGKLIAAVIYTNYRDHMIEMHIASVDKRWATRHNLKVFFSYPFSQLKLDRVQAITAASNEGAISMLGRLGFSREGYHPKAYDGGVDAISFGLLKPDCKWI